MSSELGVKFKLKAKNELREDDLRKKQALEQFREWISKQSHIKNCRTDDNFLLRFLRVKKYSNIQAFKMLENFLIQCKKYPQWFHNLSLNDERIKHLYESAYIFPLPERHENGCRVIMIQASKLDTSKYTFNDLLKIVNFVTFSLLEEEETQIAGFVYVFDHKSVPLDYISLFTLTDVKNYLQCVQNAIPGRQKLAIWFNMPSFAVKLMDVLKSLVSKKLKERAYFYSDSDKVDNHIRKNILPLEYGGTTSIESIMDEFRKIAKDRQALLKSIDDIQIDVEFIKNFNETENDVGSFRKLNLD